MKGIWRRSTIIKISCHEGKQQPELTTDCEVKSQRCNFFFLALYVHIWTYKEQNRKLLSLSPTQAYTPISAGNLCFVQRCYWLLVSSSPRDVIRPVERWSHGYKQNVTLISASGYVYIITKLFFVNYYIWGHSQLITKVTKYCSLPSISFIADKTKLSAGASLLASTMKAPSTPVVVKGRDGNACSYS